MLVKSKYILVFLLSMAGLAGLLAQELDHVQGELLVKFRQGVNAGDFVSKMNTWRLGAVSIQRSHAVVKPMNIHALSFNHAQFNENSIKDLIAAQPEVEIVQFNHLIKYRETTPDDTEFNTQWQ